VSRVTERAHRVVLAVFFTSALIAGGCRQPPAPPLPPAAVTFNKDIAPILFANCVSCHRPGEVAPFSLLTYADLVKRADAVVKETRARRMPPWLPEPGEVPILGERRLRDDQIEAIQRWATSGQAEGRPADLPPAPAWVQGWQLGRPDVVLSPERPYTATPGAEDIYRNLVLRTPLKSAAFVRAVEFKTNGAPIHHAVIRVDPSQASRRRDGADGQPGFDGMAWGSVQDPDGHFIGWAPGRGPILAPDGMPWRLERGADLVIELHLIPSKKTVEIRPTIGLFLTDTPPVQTPVTVKMSSKGIDIRAGQRDYLVTETYELPVPVDLMGIYPHAHYLGKEMRVTATLPGGSVKPLLHIREWSFHWQQDYRYAAPIPLPAGTKVTMQYRYDNSDDNVENPHHPPVRVSIGPKSTDEMAELGLQLLPKSRADAARLVDSFAVRDNLANVAMGELRVRQAPGNAEYQAFLGASYLEVERFADAVPPLEAAVRLDDRSATAHTDLGTALMQLGRLNQALAHFLRAAALAPRDERMAFNLGNALGRASRPGEAAAAYQRALAINPDFPDAHVNLGTLLSSRGRYQEALPHFERAAALAPESPFMQNNLGSALAALGRYPEAVRCVRRALELRSDYAPALENMRRLEQLGIR
jgi:tetratricopeptide (TPR) repeat protein/mono/diheme cytochrome c family protein